MDYALATLIPFLVGGLLGASLAPLYLRGVARSLAGIAGERSGRGSPIGLLTGFVGRIGLVAVALVAAGRLGGAPALLGAGLGLATAMRLLARQEAGSADAR